MRQGRKPEVKAWIMLLNSLEMFIKWDSHILNFCRDLEDIRREIEFSAANLIN